MASNLENLSDHFASSALISSIAELDDLEDAFFVAASLVVAVFFSVVILSEVLLFSTCPGIYTEPGSTRERSGLAIFLFFLALLVGVAS